MDQKQKRSIETGIMMTPLLVAFLWMGFVVLDMQTATPGVKLAPARLDSLVNVLFVFIILYAVVLVFFFIKMGKKLKAVEAAIPKAAPKKEAKPKARKK